MNFPRKGFHGTNADIDASRKMFQGRQSNISKHFYFARVVQTHKFILLRLASKLGDTIVEGRWSKLEPVKYK